jgi:DNA-binding transcriptional MocR family regulator
MVSDPRGPAALRLGFGDLDEATAREAIARLARGLRQERFAVRP